MDEFFLHFLWQFQKFKSQSLCLTTGEPLVVYDPGKGNMHAGPDFLESRVKIGGLEWSGSVEIHYKSSDWMAHRHQADPAYDNVILHVVWKEDRPITYRDGTVIPTFELSGYVKSSLESEYRKYINQPETIRCGRHLRSMNSLKLTEMIDHAAIERLQEKGQKVLSVFDQTGKNWEETAYRLLARNFGFSTNGEVFERWSELLPYTILRKHVGNARQIFAMAFGQAGFLDQEKDDYQRDLTSEYLFLQKKYGLPDPLQRHQWKFSKMRPANFPTVRLAQLAGLLNHQEHFFSRLIYTADVRSLRSVFKSEVPSYWDDHYDFGDELKRRKTHLGDSSVDVLLINTAAPLLAAYSRYLNEQVHMDKAVELLSSLKAENHSIIKKWLPLNVAPANAFDSQGLLHRYRQYCLKKRCLHCQIGVSILHSPG